MEEGGLLLPAPSFPPTNALRFHAAFKSDFKPVHLSKLPGLACHDNPSVAKIIY